MSTPTAQATVIETAEYGEDRAIVVRLEVLLTIPPAGAMASTSEPADPTAAAAWTAGRAALADAGCAALAAYVAGGGSL